MALYPAADVLRMADEALAHLHAREERLMGESDAARAALAEKFRRAHESLPWPFGRRKKYEGLNDVEVIYKGYGWSMDCGLDKLSYGGLDHMRTAARAKWFSDECRQIHQILTMASDCMTSGDPQVWLTNEALCLLKIRPV